MKKSRNLWKFVKSLLQIESRPFSKMAAENSNRSISKTYTTTRKNTFPLVTLASFIISGVISAEKMWVENWENYRRLHDWGYARYDWLKTRTSWEYSPRNDPDPEMIPNPEMITKSTPKWSTLFFLSIPKWSPRN